MVDAPASASHGVVGREALERRLAELRRQCRDPRAGIFGPRSSLWEVGKHSVAFLGAGRAALLQLAHPAVAWAIEQHSHTRRDPFGRFRRTFLHVFRMVYGDLDTALAAARAVHRVHERVLGTIPEAAGAWPAGAPYWANDPEALLWVHATLWDSALLCYERVVRPLTAQEKERFYADTRRFAALFGIPKARLPRGWTDFERYVSETLESDLLCVTSPGAEMAAFLLRPPAPGTELFIRHYAEITAWMLPEQLASGFGLERGGAAGARRTERTFERLRRLWPHLPRRLRYLPPYVEARRRLAGRTGRDRVGEWLTRLWVGRSQVG